MAKGHSKTILIIAVVLMGLLVIYVGTYFADVEPFGRRFQALKNDPAFIKEMLAGKMRTGDYRYGGRVAATVYWPLEQVDRWVRPDYWERPRSIQVEMVEDLGIVTGVGAAYEPDELDALKGISNVQAEYVEGFGWRKGTGLSSEPPREVPPEIVQQMESISKQKQTIPRPTSPNSK